MKKYFNKNLIMTEEEDFNQVTRFGYVKNSLTMKKLEIIVT